MDACEPFREARPPGSDARQKGESYKVEVYDEIVPRALAHIVADAELIADVEDRVESQLSGQPDQYKLTRIRRERAQATRRLENDRDVEAWKVKMELLDHEEMEAQAVARPVVSATEVADALANLQTLFLDAEPATQHRIVQALFEGIEVLGPSEVWLYPSVEAEARGWAGAMSGEFRVQERKSGRGERGSPFLTQQSPPLLWINKTPRESLPAEAQTA